jgi:hypothetical protein
MRRHVSFAGCGLENVATGSCAKMPNLQVLMAGYGLEDRVIICLYMLLSKHVIVYSVELQ